MIKKCTTCSEQVILGFSSQKLIEIRVRNWPQCAGKEVKKIPNSNYTLPAVFKVLSPNIELKKISVSIIKYGKLFTVLTIKYQTHCFFSYEINFFNLISFCKYYLHIYCDSMLLLFHFLVIKTTTETKKTLCYKCFDNTDWKKYIFCFWHQTHHFQCTVKNWN